jgi:thiamine biosynthesis lipoprotein
MKKLLCLLVLFFAGCASQPLYKETRLALGTFVEISVSEQKPRQEIVQAVDLAFAEILKIHHLMNRFDPQSEISKINREANKRPLRLSPEMLEIIKHSLEFSHLSEGAFDISVAPLLDTWGFYRKGKKRCLPSDQEIKAALEKVGYKNIVLDEKAATLYFAKAGMQIDLGGIAKGYAVDQARDILVKKGIKNALINAGGNIYALGKKANGQPWKVGLRHPRKPGKLWKNFVLEDKAIATSGDYENYFILDGKTYHHIFDPRSGYPVETEIASVSVITDQATDADALSTTFFVLGKAKAMELAKKLKNIELIFLSLDKKQIERESHVRF